MRAMTYSINNEKKFVYRYLTVAVLGVFAQQALANDEIPVTDLSVITIITDDKPKETVGEKITTREELNQQNVQSSHDLVRYNTEVDVAEVGRYGNRGFAIRGVDGNRVNMNIDGVGLPEVESNEIFSPYGYMYEGRLNPDLEMMSSVRVQAGSDSVMSGSGAVGGSVSYNTKEPDDLIRSGNHMGGYAKVGYTNKNEETLTAVGVAGKLDKFEAIVNYSRRVGHETKNHAMRKHDKDTLDLSYGFTLEEMPMSKTESGFPYNTVKSLVYPDPMHYEREAVLGKLYYNLSDVHRFGVHGIYQYGLTHLNAESKQTNTTRLSSTTRRAYDEDELTSYGLNYRYRPMSHDWLNELNLDYTKNKVIGVADTWNYRERVNIGTADNPVFSNVKLDERKYRPNETKTDQVSLGLTSQEFDWGKLGVHRFDVKSNYIKQDYTQNALALGYTNNIWNSSASYLDFVFPDNKKTNYNITLVDNIEWSDKFKTMLGIRYDNYHYQPYFDNTEYAFTNSYTGNLINRRSESLWVKEACNGSNLPVCKIANLDGSISESKFDHITWAGAFDYQFNDKLAGRYKLGTGFVAPTTTQMYSSFQGLDARQIPNLKLKPETSFNNELELQYDFNDAIRVTLGGYLTKYKDFIHTKYWQGDESNGGRHNAITGCARNMVCMTSVNLDDAEVKGIRLGIKGDVSNWLNLDGNLGYSFDYHTASDKATVETDYNGKLEINTLASVPTSAIIGLDYVSPMQDWTLHSKIRYVGRKKADDAKTIQLTRATNGTDPYAEVVGTYESIDRSKSFTVLDIYGTKRFGKDHNWILNAGVYNVTDKKYISWESLRQLANVSVNNMIDKETGYGYSRYTAPGRNYAVSLTYEF